jgi:hypothetical protein
VSRADDQADDQADGPLGGATEEVLRGLLSVMPRLREDLLNMLGALDDGCSVDIAEVSDTFECAWCGKWARPRAFSVLVLLLLACTPSPSPH